jgi:predicted molibdopterin-dependent oxidoreductase YjgC
MKLLNIQLKARTNKKQYGSDAIAGLSSSKCTNEENYLMQKFMRAVIGTNSMTTVPDCDTPPLWQVLPLLLDLEQ